jgi:hypothetical protein
MCLALCLMAGPTAEGSVEKSSSSSSSSSSKWLLTTVLQPVDFTFDAVQQELLRACTKSPAQHL